MRPSQALSASLVAAALALAGCDRPPSADGLREWAPADHDRAEEQSAAGQGGRAPQPGAAQAPPRAGAPAGSAAGTGALVEVAWRQNCALCHGAAGKGDGPNGPMVKAPDLTLDAWQKTVSDAEIVAIIRAGRGRMPAFDLPEPVVNDLVKRIRALRGH